MSDDDGGSRPEQLSEFIPSRGFIKDYCDAASACTDAPVGFHLLMAYALLSTCASKIEMDFGAQPIRPNLWILLLAPTSFFRKSTCLSIARKIINQVDQSLIMPSEFSKEKLYDIIADRSDFLSGAFIWSEFGGVMATLEKTFMAGTKEFFADLFDIPDVYSKSLKKEGSQPIRNGYFSVWTASSISWFVSRIKEVDIQGGFLTRFMFCFVNHKPRNITLPPPLPEGSKMALASFLTKLRMTGNRARLTPQATEYFHTWSRETEEEMGRQEQGGNSYISLFRRTTQHALKIAILNACAELSMDEVIFEIDIQKEHIERACMMMNEMVTLSKKVLIPELAAIRTKELKKLYRIIEKYNGALKGALMGRTRLSTRDFNEATQTLADWEYIQIVETLSGSNNRKGQKYIINPEKSWEADDDIL